MTTPPPMNAGTDMLDSLPTQMGLMNALRTGNMVLDMLVCMCLPLLFGGIAAVTKEVVPSLRRVGTWVKTRNEVTRTVSYERRVNMYGWTVGTVTQDHYLQKAIMLYIAKHMPKKRTRTGTLTLSDLPKKEQDKASRGGGRDGGYDSDDSCCDDDDRYGPAATLRKLEVTVMPPDDQWIEFPVEGGEAGEAVHLLKSQTSDNEGSEKAPFRSERTTLMLRAKGSRAEAHIQAFVDKAFAWYKQRLETQKDEKRYMFKDPLLYLLDHFQSKSGKFAISGFPHKLGLLLHGPPGTGKTSLIKAIAHYTKRHIVSVPLSRIRTNQELMDVIFDQSFHVVNTQRSSDDEPSELPMLLDFKHTIFVMEDVDAASKVVQRRAPSSQYQPKTSITTTTVTRNPSTRPGVVGDGAAEASSSLSQGGGGSGGLAPPMIMPQRSHSALRAVADAAAAALAAAGGTRPANPPAGAQAGVAATAARQDSNASGSGATEVCGGGEGTDSAAQVVAVEERIEVVAEGDGAGSSGSSGAGAGPGKKSEWAKLRELEDDALDLAGLLNVLDGVVDSPNRIVIMTTNHPERLDPALIRPGRINKQILMGYLQPEDALMMVEHYFGETTAAQRKSFSEAFLPNVFTPAQVEQLCAEYDTVDQLLGGLSTLTPNQY